MLILQLSLHSTILFGTIYQGEVLAAPWIDLKDGDDDDEISFVVRALSIETEES